MVNDDLLPLFDHCTKMSGSVDNVLRLDKLSLIDTDKDTDSRAYNANSQNEAQDNKFGELIRRLTSDRTNYVHDYTSLDPLKFAIGKSIFIKNSHIMTLYAPIQQFQMPNFQSTVAILDRGLAFPPIQALSGWGHKSDKDLSRISGRLWTEEVFLVSDYVGHVLQPDTGRDQGRSGWLNVSHANSSIPLRYHTRFRNEWGANKDSATLKNYTAMQRSEEVRKPDRSIRNSTIGHVQQLRTALWGRI